MLRRWFNTKADKSVRNRQFTASGNNRFGQFEQLEEKRCLAFVGFFDGVTLTLEQTIDDGDVVVDNSGIGNAWRVTDNSGTLSFVNSENLIVELLDDTANQINLNANFQHNGSVTIDAGHGPRDIQFTGSNFPFLGPNVFTGDVTVLAGDSVQNILWSPVIGNPLIVGGNFTAHTGQGFDTMFNSHNFVTIGGDVDLVGVNDFLFLDFLFPVPLDAFMTVGGNFSMDTSNESIESFYFDNGTFHEAAPDPDEERTVIGGDFIYRGGDDIDHVNLNNIHIRGDLDIDLGEGIPFFGDPQNVTSSFIAPRVVNGEGGGPYFELNGNARIAAGDASLDNVITLNGYFDGNTVDFEMGGLVDIINYNWIGNQADVTADMGTGDDVFTLNQHLNLLIIDWHNDAGDQFINNIGKFTFDADMLNYHWFNHIYTVGDDTLELTQLTDTGDVTIDNTGGITGVAWRVQTPLGFIAAETTPANNLILNMLDNTGNNVIMDLANPVLAFLTLNLGDGDRNVDFVGASNNPLRDINIFADAGVQNVELSVNAPLAVATLNIDLGAGFDTVDDDANNLSLSEDLIFKGVNHFENDGILSIGRHMSIDTTDDSTTNLFANNATMVVAGTFTYAGGDGRDELRMNGAGGTSIGLTSDINLGDNLAGGEQHALFNHPNVFLGNDISVVSTNATSADRFELDAGASINGNIIVDLGGGVNDATIVGAVGVAGGIVTYLGGDDVDTVTLGTTGTPVQFTGNLGQGDDCFTLLAGTSLTGPFIVNFGGNADKFVNSFGAFTFDAELLGLNGFNHIFDLTDSKLTSTQIIDQGAVTIDNNGTMNAIRFTTNGVVSEIAPVTSMQVDLLGDTFADVTIDWDSNYAGSLELNMNSGPRVLTFSGADNSMAGPLLVTAGTGDHIVNVAPNATMNVAGDATFDLGIGMDVVNGPLVHDFSVGGDLTFLGVNEFFNSTVMSVGGNFLMNSGSEAVDTVFNDDGDLIVSGDFTYVGSTANDLVNLSSTNAGAIIGGNINLSMNAGDNSAFLQVDSTAGTEFNYAGGDGVDLVHWGMASPGTDINVNLGSGDDTFALDAGVGIINDLFVNFGTGNDTFINPNGPFTFPATLLGLNGFNHTFDPVTGTLSSTQVESKGNVLVNDNGPGNAVQVIADGNTTILGPVTSLTVNMLNGSLDNLTVDIDAGLTGNFVANLGSGDRVFNMTGTNNTFGGDVTITGSDGAQTANVSMNSDLGVGGNLVMDMGLGRDIMDLTGNNLAVVGNADLNNLNEFTADGNVNVGGNLKIDSSGEATSSHFVDAAMMDVAGDFTYFGGDSSDMITLNGNSQIGGNIDINAGAGSNEADITGIFGGDTIKYTGAGGADDVHLHHTGNDANVNVKLGAGDDVFQLDAGTTIAEDLLRVDFGGGDDQFENNFGMFDFNARLLDLDGYDAIFDLATGNIDIIQVADTGDVNLDNNGTADTIRFGELGKLNELTPANDVKLILMDNSSTEVTVDFDNVRNGNTTIQLRSGDRDVFFTGNSNTYNGLFRVEAADGIQNIHVSINAPLSVTGTAVVNTRMGSDTIFAANAINISEAFLVRNVNQLVNNTGLNVGGDLNFVTHQEDEDTRFISNTTMNVGGNLTYLGGGGVDSVNFKDTGATIGGFTYIDLKTASDAVNKQSVKLTGGFNTTSLVIDGGTSTAGNFVKMDANTFVDGGLVIVNFASSTTTNTVLFDGQFTGTYGTYRGGSGADFVSIAAEAANLEFASITGDGNDILTVENTTQLDFLYGDMGGGNDFLDNKFGSFPFDNNIFNL